MPGKEPGSLNCELNIALILFARAIIPSSWTIGTATVWWCCSRWPITPVVLPRLNGLTGFLTTPLVSCEWYWSVSLQPDKVECIWRFCLACTGLNPVLRLCVRLMCTSTPGFSGQRGAGLGWMDDVQWLCDLVDSVGLGGPPSGLVE